MTVRVDKYTLFVICVSVFIAVWLGVSAWDINFIPADPKGFYLEAARRLPQLKYISRIHDISPSLYGKDVHILCASLMQRLIKDFETLRPFLLVCLIGVCGCSIFVFYIARKLWGSIVGLICFGLFATCFWPYMYVLFVMHQITALLFFLLAVLTLLCATQKIRGRILCMASGLALCLSMYSSIAAALYIPLYVTAFVYKQFLCAEKKSIKDAVITTILILFGFAAGFLYFNYPDIGENVKGYLGFVERSHSRPSFFYNQSVLIQWIKHPELPVRAGWLWVVRYFRIVLPVLFPAYLFCSAYLILRCLKIKDERKKWCIVTTLLFILLSVSAPILAEIRGVAQLGRNYFAFLIGIILLIGYTFFAFLGSDWLKVTTSSKKRAVFGILIILFAVNVFINASIFFSDVYPSRMATAFFVRTIDKLGIKTIYCHLLRNPHRRNIIDCLQPDFLKKIKFMNIDNINQVKEGYILIFPTTGSSIHRAAASTFNDFDEDIYLNELLRKGNIGDYAVASFNTMTSSRIWFHEGEILTYKALVLGHPVIEDLNRTKVWLLDARKLQRDRRKNMPSSKYINLLKNGIRNIGSKSLVYNFEGFEISTNKVVELSDYPVRIFKVGNPRDKLVAYLYKRHDVQPIWVPVNDYFTSLPVNAGNITDDAKGRIVPFKFSRTIILTPGRYKLVIYRTGESDSKNFYRIYLKGILGLF